jgi:hypothetical protein
LPKPKKRESQNKKSGLMLDPKDLQGRLRFIGGSASDHWNNILVNQATNSLWAHPEEGERDRRYSATVVALAAIAPKDELEAMMAAQLLAAHNATMECYRRAMRREQTFEGRSEALNQADKLSRTYAVLLDALNRQVKEYLSSWMPPLMARPRRLSLSSSRHPIPPPNGPAH